MSSYGHTRMVQRLLDQGARVDFTDDLVGFPLQAASGKGHLETMQLLLNHGADPNAYNDGDPKGNALERAAVEGQLEAVQLLLSHGARLHDWCGEYGCILHAAVKGGNKDIVRLILESEVDVNSKDDFNEPALFVACGSPRSLDIARMLIRYGADVNGQGGPHGNALQVAVSFGSVDLIELLLDSGADVNARGGCRNTALQAAAYGGNLEGAKTLLARGADANAETNQSESIYRNALEAAIGQGHEDMVQLLVDNGATNA